MPRETLIHRLGLSAMIGLAGVVCGPVAAARGQDTLFSIPDTVKLPAVVDSSGSAGVPAVGSTVTVLGQTPAADPKADEAEDELEILIVRALERKTDLDVDEVPIRQAVEQLGGSTGIPIEMEPRTFDLLPYGSKTIVSAKIQGRPLRECLTALLRPIGLTFAAEQRQVVIRPTPPLGRVVRRATWEELATLEKLYSQPWSAELADSLSFQFQDARAGDLEVNRDTLLRLADSVGAGLAADVLDHACDRYGWCWYPAGEYVAVLSKTRQIERQLDRRVSLRYSQTSLAEALMDLARRADVLLEMAPGLLASLPPQTTERFSCSIENATVRQALEFVAGYTGLGYSVEPDGIRLTTGTAPAPTTRDAAGVDAALRALRANAIIGHITIPNKDGSSFSFFIRENDLPPEVNEMRQAKIRQAINDIRRSLMAEQPQD